MEDAHCAELDFDEKTGLFGVFDGHGGCDVAMYVAIHIAKVLHETDSYKSGKFEKALKDTFMELDKNVLDKNTEEALKFLQTYSSTEKLPNVKELNKLVKEYKKERQEQTKEAQDETQALCEEATMNIEEVLKRYEVMAMNKAAEESVSLEKSSAEHNEKKEKLEKALDDASKPVKEETTETSEEEKTETSNETSSPKSSNGVKKENDSKDVKSCGDSLDSEEKSEEKKNGNGNSSKGETPKKLTKVKPQKMKKSPQKVELDDDEDEDDADFQVSMNDDGSDEESEEESSGDEDSEEEDDDEDSWEDMDEADKNSAVMLNEFIQESSSVEQPGHDSGTTATVALLVKKKLLVANAGDSRCVVSRKDGKVHAMSEDHKPEDEIEMKRIEKAGGEVSEQGRINGGLNLSRAIGDHNYKKNKQLPHEEQMVSYVPDVTTIELNEHDEFMVLACDGIWNVMDNQEVVDFVRERLYPEKYNKKYEPLSLCEINKQLFDKCLASSTTGDGTGCDNMTCMIVKFHPDWLKSMKRSSECDDQLPAKSLKRDNDEIPANS